MKVDPVTLDRYVDDGLLRKRSLNGLSIYSYTEKCVHSRSWDDITMMARGLIIDDDSGDVVALPFRKFFNHTEHGVHVSIPDDKPDAITLKLDGSLGISYKRDGELCWATRGSFDSPQAAIAQDMWGSRFAHVDVPDEWTLLAEIIHPETKNVVDYADRQELIVLGIIDRTTGEDLSHREVSKWCGSVGLHVVEAVNLTYADVAKLAGELDDQHEGFVVRWRDYRVKVKSKVYLSLARLLTGLTDRRIADLWYAGITYADLPALPEEARGEIDFRHEDLELAANTLKVLINDLCEVHEEEPLRDVAEQYQGSWALGPLMRALRGQDNDYRRIIYRRRFSGNPRPTHLNAYGGFSRGKDQETS